MKKLSLIIGVLFAFAVVGMPVSTAFAQNGEDQYDDETTNYCNPDNKPASGSIEQWLVNAPEGADTDCLDVQITEEGNTVTATLSDRVVGIDYGVEVVEGDLPPAEEIPASGADSDSLTFEEGNGEQQYTVYIYGAEGDYFATAGEQDSQAAYINGGVSGQVDTTPQEPTNYCDPDNKPASGSIEEWLRNAPEDANTDCLDVEITEEGNTVNASLADRVVGFDYGIDVVEGGLPPAEEIPASGEDSASLTFDEDTGEREYTVYVYGPESGYFVTAGEQDSNAAYVNGGISGQINTTPPEPTDPEETTPEDTTPEETTGEETTLPEPTEPEETTGEETTMPDEGTDPEPTEPEETTEDDTGNGDTEGNTNVINIAQYINNVNQVTYIDYTVIITYVDGSKFYMERGVFDNLIEFYASSGEVQSLIEEVESVPNYNGGELSDAQVEAIAKSVIYTVQAEDSNYASASYSSEVPTVNSQQYEQEFGEPYADEAEEEQNVGVLPDTGGPSLVALAGGLLLIGATLLVSRRLN